MLNMTNVEYRKQLINNGATIAGRNFDMVSKNCCVPPQYTNAKTNNTPHLFSKCDKDYPYKENDLKRQYMESHNTKCSNFSIVFK